MDYNRWPRELKTFAEAQQAFQTNSWFYWAPGDMTKYRVSMVHNQAALLMFQQMLMSNALKPEELAERTPGNIDQLVVQVADGVFRADSLVIDAPTEEFNKWNPRRWADRGFPTGWWAGIRPLLAALDWTDPEFAQQEFHCENNMVFVAMEG